MGLRDLMRQSDPINLRLPSLGSGIEPLEAKRLDAEEAYRLRLERMRKNIQNARAGYLGEVGETVVMVTRGLRQQVEAAARECPEERAQYDMILDAVVMGGIRIVGEQAG